MADSKAATSPSLVDLPLDELLRYGHSLGLTMPDDTDRGEALRLVRARQELLVELDREAMFDVVVWLRQPVRKSAGKEQLAELIANHAPMRFDGVSDRGLDVLVRLSGIEFARGAPRPEIERLLRKRAGMAGRMRRLRRRVVGSLIAKLLSPAPTDGRDTYRFLPEHDAESLRNDIEHDGLVVGVKRKLKGVADDYVREKLDEIERRIDAKLDEIDARLSEWRDREVTHRLNILKWTLAVSILVALLSLLYDRLRG